jgi:LEA14-like dessication related protein
MTVRAWVSSLVLASLVLLMVIACSSLSPQFKSPQLDVVEIHVLKGDLLHQQLRVRMHAQNPNDVALAVRSITYEMEVAGEAFAQGKSERPFTVPAHESAEFDISVSANVAGALLRLLMGGGKLDAVDYRLHGKVSLASGFLRSIPFDKKGVFKLR